MRAPRDPRDAPEFIGVAGRWANEQERSYVRQAVFLLRYRLRVVPPEPSSVAAPHVVERE